MLDLRIMNVLKLSLYWGICVLVLLLIEDSKDEFEKIFEGPVCFPLLIIELSTQSEGLEFCILLVVVFVSCFV
jgi:hypothetical protein